MKKSAGDIVVLHMCTKKSKSCDVWFLRYGVQQTELFVIIDCFLPFYHPLDPENFSKIKKTLQDIIILQMFTEMTVR